jgi:HD-GYP domain-containing protein (c-di-GMP phosphodiesterase class II)
MNTHSRNNETHGDYIGPDTGEGCRAPLHHERDFEQMKQNLTVLYDKKVKRWIRAMDLYDREITEHTLRVTALSLKLGQGMNFSASQLEFIQYGTLLHDIGKLGIPERIMQKPGKLTPFEYQVVQQHPIYAHEWLVNRPEYEPAKVIPLYHHERWDGTGYPYGLKGKEIPFLARVVAVCDVWDAITSDRPYRKAISKDQAITLMQSKSGRHFDPDVLDMFMFLGLHENRKVPCTFPAYV